MVIATGMDHPSANPPMNFSHMRHKSSKRRLRCCALAMAIFDVRANIMTMGVLGKKWAVSPTSVIPSCFAPTTPATSWRVLYPSSASECHCTSTPQLYNVDIRYNRRSPLIFDPRSGRFLDLAHSASDTLSLNSRHAPLNAPLQRWTHYLHSAFVPEGVTLSYYRFMRWRILQRFFNANVHVIGTQSLLMGLRGMHRKGAMIGLGAAAATNWVLKDTLGKIVRMVWASKMGRKFDSDAKRWRFRSSLIYALGNGLEVTTYLHPKYFLVLAMLANSCKQMSMLTSSATRNALYNSFKRVLMVNAVVGTVGTENKSENATLRRGGDGIENIGDITAKGEAQIAVVDLLGIASGISLSRAVGVSVKNVFVVWVVLQVMEIFCMYHEMRSVVYKTFNFERMYTLLGFLLDNHDNKSIDKNETLVKQEHIPTPEQIAAKEKVFLSPDHLARQAIAFGSPGRTVLDPDELRILIGQIFRGEKYFLVVGQDIKNARGLSAKFRQWRRKQREGKLVGQIDPQEQCHIVLHADANNLDILKSALALLILRRKLVKRHTDRKRDFHGSSNHVYSPNYPSVPLRSRDCIDVLNEARIEADLMFPQLLRELTKQGWHPPLRSMLGRVSTRAEWPIQRMTVLDHEAPASVAPDIITLT